MWRGSAYHQPILVQSVRPRSGSLSEEEERIQSKEQGQGSRGSLHSVGLESQGSPASRRSQSRPSMLAVTVHRARKLEKKGMFGKADPYVLVRLGDQKVKSKTVGNSQNPEWDFVANVNFNGDQGLQLVIEVLDDDVGRDDLLGSTTISMIGILQSQGFSEKWFTLEGCKSGEALVSVQCLSPISRDPSIHSAKASPAVSKTPSRTASLKSVEVLQEQKTKEMTAGTITLTVHRAKKLEKKGMFGKADPYVVVSLGPQQYKSHTVSNSHSPEWGWQTVFKVDSTTDRSLTIEVWDEDVGKDDIMGRLTLDTGKLLEGAWFERWLPLESCKSGELQLSAHFTPQVNGEPSPAPLVRGELSFCVLAARDLEKDGLWGKADPYVLLKLGEQRAKSGTVGNTQDPVWNFTAQLQVDETTPLSLTLEVWDSDLGADDLLGRTSLPLASLLQGGQLFDQWIPLQEAKSGQVQVAASFRPLGSQIQLEAPVQVLAQPPDSSDSDSDSDNEGADIRTLNNRMLGCMDKVRLLQQAKEAFAGGFPDSFQGDRSDDMAQLSRRYEEELSSLRERCAVAEGRAAREEERAEGLARENRELGGRLREQEARLGEREAAVATLEGEVAELLGRLNLLQAQREREKEQEAMLTKELEEAKGALQEARQELAREKVQGAELAVRSQGVQRELAFRIQVLEEQLEQERRRTTLDFSDRDDKMKSEYEKILSSELKVLRRKYRQETERTKQEFLNLHSNKLGKLQQELSEERTNNSSAREELILAQGRLDEYRRRMAELEETNLGLGQRAEVLASSLDEEGAVFRAQLRAKEQEVGLLQGGIDSQRKEYEEVLEQKLALDTEIAVYKGLIDAMDKRLRGGLLPNGSLGSQEDVNQVMEGKKEGKDDTSSSSESEAEDSGIFTKIKEKVSDALD